MLNNLIIIAYFISNAIIVLLKKTVCVESTTVRLIDNFAGMPLNATHDKSC